jgi:hypothetical protein
MINDDIVVQVLDALKEKTAQAQTQETQLMEKFQVIVRETDKAQQGLVD